VKPGSAVSTVKGQAFVLSPGFIKKGNAKHAFLLLENCDCIPISDVCEVPEDTFTQETIATKKKRAQE